MPTPAGTQPVTQQQLAEALDNLRLQLLAHIQTLVSLPVQKAPAEALNQELAP
jgi:hypothetical protein